MKMYEVEFLWGIVKGPLIPRIFRLEALSRLILYFRKLDS